MSYKPVFSNVNGLEIAIGKPTFVIMLIRLYELQKMDVSVFANSTTLKPRAMTITLLNHCAGFAKGFNISHSYKQKQTYLRLGVIEIL